MKGDTPTFKQKMFARKYVQLKGKGTQAAMETYDVKKRATAKALAHQNLNKPVVQQEIKKIMESSGMSLSDLGKDLREVIDQGLQSGKASLSDALGGLREAYKLHNAYPAARSLKLVYSRQEQVASKDLQKVVDDLKTITKRANSLIDATE